MDAEYGLTCSSINLRAQPSMSAPVSHALGPQEPVDITGEAGEMLEVRANRWKPPLTGYVLRSSIVRGAATPEAFPVIEVETGISIPAVPASLPLPAFRGWLDSGDESPWLPANYVDLIRAGQRPSVGALIRKTIADRASDWSGWNAELKAEGRESSASLDEWMALVEGGRAMWSIRAERIFAEASEHSAGLGWVVPQDVVHWTGHVRFSLPEPKYKTWYEVELTKLDRQLRGWYKADLLNPFVLPTRKTDLRVPENRSSVFDLSRSRLRVPLDPEIDAARKAGRAAAQYIDVKRALGWGVLHHNLCGEFCVAALSASDVIPLLTRWLPSYGRAREILAGDHGTSIPDLEAMLTAMGMTYEFYRAEGSISPITPSYLRQKLDAGRMAIVFTGVTQSGVVKSHSPIRHWVVLEDVLRVGNSGWLRVYNPFPNREEVYRFDDVFDMPSRSSIGLWVEPRRIASSNVVDFKAMTSAPMDVALHSQPFG